MALYGAVIFDLDGTLVDTRADIANACNRILAARGFPVHPMDQYRFFVGGGLKNLVVQVLPEKERTQKRIAEMITAFYEDYGQNCAIDSRCYDGIYEMLDVLDKTGVPMAVLSNKPHGLTVKCMDAFLKDYRFDPVFGQREDVPIKPDPAGALEIARIFQTDPARFLLVGDSSTDMDTALAAGMTGVGVCWGFRPEAELRAHKARFILDHPMELVDLLSLPDEPGD